MSNGEQSPSDKKDAVFSLADQMRRDEYETVADAVQEIADAAAEAFKRAGIEPGEWDSDNIVQDVKRGIVGAIERLASLSAASSSAGLLDDTLIELGSAIGKLAAIPEASAIRVKLWELWQRLEASPSSASTPDLPTHENIADMLPAILAGSERCPLCGTQGAHEHTPAEIVIYRNGVKYGRSLNGISSESHATTIDAKLLDALRWDAVRYEEIVYILMNGGAISFHRARLEWVILRPDGGRSSVSGSLSTILDDGIRAGGNAPPSAKLTNEWIEWDGARGVPPIAPDARVDVRFRNGDTVERRRVDNWLWKWQTPPGQYDIAAYKLSRDDGTSK